MENICERFTKNYDIYGSQKPNELLYYEEIEQKINLLIRTTIILPIQDRIQI